MHKVLTVILLLAGVGLILDAKYVEGELAIVIGMLVDIASAIGTTLYGVMRVNVIAEQTYDIITYGETNDEDNNSRL